MALRRASPLEVDQLTSPASGDYEARLSGELWGKFTAAFSVFAWSSLNTRPAELRKSLPNLNSLIIDP